MTLIGAREFKARLNAIRDTGRVVASDWADDSVDAIQREIPRVTGETAASVQAGSVSSAGASVVGSPVVLMLAKGTRSHLELPRDAQALRWQTGGRTIFSKRVNHPATRAYPKILQAAVDSVSGMAQAMINLWNRAA